MAEIYLLETNLGYYKIGYSTKLRKRLRNFGVKLPFEVELLTSIEVSKDKGLHYEAWLHNYFSDKRVNGEWFALDYFSLKLIVEVFKTESDIQDYIDWMERETAMGEGEYYVNPGVYCLVRKEKRTMNEVCCCPDCGVPEGKIHKDGCDMEYCPRCDGQLISCDCTFIYEDDRIPYIEYPNVCAKCGVLYPDLFMVSDEEWESYIQPDMRDKVICKDCYTYIKQAIDKGAKPAPNFA